MPQNRIYKVFISSTFLDLKEERKLIFDEIVKAECVPIGMENFAAGGNSWKRMTEAIDKCDIYVVLQAHRYGTVEDGQERSYTEKEYDYAVGKKLYILPFVQGDKKQWSADRVSGDETKREAFRKRLFSDSNGCNWTKITDLGSHFTNSFKDALNHMPENVGWVPADSVLPSSEVPKSFDDTPANKRKPPKISEPEARYNYDHIYKGHSFIDRYIITDSSQLRRMSLPLLDLIELLPQEELFTSDQVYALVQKWAINNRYNLDKKAPNISPEDIESILSYLQDKGLIQSLHEDSFSFTEHGEYIVSLHQRRKSEEA